MELGNSAEALAEAGQIAPRWRRHPEVLALYWEIHAARKQWGEALEAARTSVQLAPERVDSWIRQSFALHELRRTQEAWDALLPVVDLFPADSTIPYNLACYSCQLDQMPAALNFLKRAMKPRGKEEVRAMALKDEDLKPLWDQIKRL